MVGKAEISEKDRLSAILQRRNSGIKLFGIGFIGLILTVPMDSFGIGVIFWFVGVVGLLKVLSVAYVSCPYCKKQFFWTWFWSNPLTSKCMHCKKGLPNS